MKEKVRRKVSYLVRRSATLLSGKWLKNFGSIDTRVVSSSPEVLRETIRVGNRVHSRPATGNGMFVKLCRSEDFPTD